MSSPENLGAIDVVAQVAVHQPMAWRHRAGFGLAGAALSTVAGVLAPSPVFADSDAIYAGPDNVSTYMNTATDPIEVLANDTDSTGSPLTVEGVDPDYGPNAGTVTFNRANSTFVYTPDAGFTGEDTFLYMDRDAAGNEQDGVVTVDVQEAGSGGTGPIVSISKHCADPYKKDGTISVSVTDTGSDGQHDTYQVLAKAQNAIANTPEPTEGQLMDLQGGETAVQQFNVSNGEYKVEVIDGNTGAIMGPVHFVTEALCKVLNVKGKILHHLDNGKYALVKVNNHASSVNAHMRTVINGHGLNWQMGAGDSRTVPFNIKRSYKGGHLTPVKVSLYDQVTKHGTKSWALLSKYTFFK